MSKKIQYKYCKTCKHEVEDGKRKPLDTMQNILWIIICVGTLGIAAIALLFYLSGKPKVYCPDCYTKLEFSDKPFEKPKKKPEKMTAKEKILDKAGIEVEEEPEQPEEPKPTKKKPETKKKEKKKIEDEEDKLYCPYCGEELDEKYAICPFCETPLKF